MSTPLLITDNTIIIVIYLATWFLLPIIPAFLFFKLLPNKAIVNGPFKGLRIDLGGAFAGYFLLFITAVPFMSRLIRLQSERYQIWSIGGKVFDERTNLPIPKTKNPRIILFPLNNIDNEEYHVVLAAEVMPEKWLKFPQMRVEADGYIPVTLSQLDFPLGEKPRIENCEIRPDYRTAKFMKIQLKDTINQKVTKSTEDD